jgi:hypothetical protein
MSGAKYLGDVSTVGRSLTWLPPAFCESRDSIAFQIRLVVQSCRCGDGVDAINTMCVFAGRFA